MPKYNDTPKCCRAAETGGVVWMTSWYDGPKHDGWTINCNRNSYVDPSFENVYYCPYCGAKLPEEK